MYLLLFAILIVLLYVAAKLWAISDALQSQAMQGRVTESEEISNKLDELERYIGNLESSIASMAEDIQEIKGKLDSTTDFSS